MIETVITCPLGSKCEEIKDGKLHRCAWFVQLQGKNPQSEEPIDEWSCAIAWMPILQIENAQQTRGVQAATESFRNEMVEGNQQLTMVMAQAANKKLLEH